MIQIKATKRGVGIEIWGTYNDLEELYQFIGKFWSIEKYENVSGFASRDKVLSGFVHEIRKAKEGSRLKRNIENQEYFGAQISWVHCLFSLSALKYNMRFFELSKIEIAQILILEYDIEVALKAYDEVGATNLIGYIEDGLYGANPHIYQYMRYINLEFFKLGGGKNAFRKLPKLLQKGVYYTDEYRDYASFLKAESERIKCSIDDLELSDDHFDYESIKW